MATQDKVTLQDQQNQYTKAQKATKEALELIDTLAACQQKLVDNPFKFTPSQGPESIEIKSKLRAENSQLTFKKAVENINDFSSATDVGNAIKANLNIPSLLTQGNNPNLDAQSSITTTFIKSTIRPEVFNAEAHLTDSLNYNYYAGHRDRSISYLNQLRVLFKYTQDTLELSKKAAEQNNLSVTDQHKKYLKDISECSDIIDKIKNKLNEGNKLSEDLIKTIAIAGAGYIEDAKNPGTFIKSSAPEKDPWGIRFTVTTAANSRVVQKQLQQKADSQSGRTIIQDGEGSLNEKGELTPAEKRNNVRIDKTIFDEAGAFFNRQSYYMHLLPAIRSNLPIQGGTDVPGVQPGLNFRIEHSIVKHKIPGFQPVYQPMGVDSIRCTLVGCFTGADGMDLWNEQQQLEARLGEREGFKGKQITTIPLDLVGRGDYFESIQKSNRAPGYLNDLANVSVAYDAFKNAQDFYSMIVAPGIEVEVELNLKKNDMVRTKGAPGPFRNTETGNPQFKAFIRRMDLYYVRADRCWYILDLEVTDGGLIGKECINLTNIIDQTSTSIEEAQQALAELNERDKDIINCIQNDPNTQTLNTASKNKEFYFSPYGYGYFKIRNQTEPEELLNPVQVGELLVSSNDGSQEGQLDRNSGFGNTEFFAELLYAEMLINGYKDPEKKNFNGSSGKNQLGEPLMFSSSSKKARYRYDSVSKNFIRVDKPRALSSGKDKIFANQVGGSVEPGNTFGDDVIPLKDFLKLITNQKILPSPIATPYGVIQKTLDFLADVQSSLEPDLRRPIEEICKLIQGKDTSSDTKDTSKVVNGQSPSTSTQNETYEPPSEETIKAFVNSVISRDFETNETLIKQIDGNSLTNIKKTEFYKGTEIDTTKKIDINTSTYHSNISVPLKVSGPIVFGEKTIEPSSTETVIFSFTYDARKYEPGKSKYLNFSIGIRNSETPSTTNTEDPKVEAERTLPAAVDPNNPTP